MKPVKWGVIGAAKIGMEQVIPAMMRGDGCEIVAIASRSQEKAEAAAAQLGIAKAHGSYEALLADPEIEAVYNPLPNDLHVPVSIAALDAGKHVLCEKPIALNAAELETLIAARERSGKLIAEAFMVRHHPQWKRARNEVRRGALGELRAIQYAFGYFNDDPANIRNIPAHGGGALYDIGVYPIVTSRYLFGAEPVRVMACIDRDPVFGTDRLISAVLDYGVGQASFICSTQMVPFQRAQVFGTEKRLEIEIPFNAISDQSMRLFIDDGSELGDWSAVEVELEACDQYRLQGEAFSRYIREGTPPEFPLEDSLRTLRVVDALFDSARSGCWVALEG